MFDFAFLAYVFFSRLSSIACFVGYGAVNDKRLALLARPTDSTRAP